MKILQIGMGNVAGGLEAFVMNYYRVLVHMDIQFDFVCMYDKIAYEEEIRKLGGRIMEATISMDLKIRFVIKLLPPYDSQRLLRFQYNRRRLQA